MLDYEIEIVDAELGRGEYASAALYIKGKRINHIDFSTTNPSTEEIESKLRMLALRLCFNARYAQYKRDLRTIAFPFGQ